MRRVVIASDSDNTMSVWAHRRDCIGVGKRAAVRLLAAPIAAALVFAAVPAHAQSDDRPSASASTLEDISPPASGDWDRVEAAPTDPADRSSDNQVLEIPQATDPNAAQVDSGGDSSADASQQAQQNDGSYNDDGADAPDQVGSIDDYQSQQDDIGLAGGYIPPIASAPIESRPLGMSPPSGAMIPPVGFNPAMRPMMPVPYVPPVGMLPGGMLAPGPVIIQPGVRGYIPPTSPMAPSLRAPASIPGGWWMRARR